MIVLDTDLLVGILKNDSEAVSSAVKMISADSPVRTTIINAEELLTGVNEKAEELLREIGVLSYEWEEMKETVKLGKLLKKKGRPIGVNDEKIAGICLANNASILTRNKKHFSKVPGLKVRTW